MQITVGKYYRLQKKISQGSFGQVYYAVHQLQGRPVAVKLQQISTKHPQLEYEAKLLAYLLDKGPGIGLPKLYYFGKEQGYNVMVMQMLGPSLEQLFLKMGKRFQLQSVVMIGRQILGRLEALHTNKFIYRDIKPENFLLGVGHACGTVHLIDFGLSKKYVKQGEHIPYCDDKSLIGTPRYASLNAHLGIEQSRRDDLESLVYMLIYFLKGALPWQDLPHDPSYKRHEKILQKKLSVSIQELTSTLPSQFAELLSYTRGLHFSQQPDYRLMSNLLEQALLSTGRQCDMNAFFCWEKEPSNDYEHNQEDDLL